MKVVAKSVLLSISMAALLTVPPGRDLQALVLAITAVLVFIA